MPIYRYRALTDNGIVVTNTIEESSKYAVIKRLKRNNLSPIDVQQSLQRTKSKRNIRKNTRTYWRSSKRSRYSKPFRK